MKKKDRYHIEAPVHEPTITYDRTLSLTALDGRRLRLSHLRDLMSHAVDHGFTADAKVTVRSGGYGSDYSTITVSEDR